MWHGDKIYFLSDRDDEQADEPLRLRPEDQADPPAHRLHRVRHQVPVAGRQRHRRSRTAASSTASTSTTKKADKVDDPDPRRPPRRPRRAGEGRRQGSPTLRHRARRQAGPLRRPRRRLHRPGQERRHPQPDQHPRRPRTQRRLVARRQVDRLHLRRHRRGRNLHRPAGRLAAEPQQLTTQRRHLHVPSRLVARQPQDPLGRPAASACVLSMSRMAPSPMSIRPSSGSSATIVWSPDSQWIAFVRPETETMEKIYLYSLADRQLRRRSPTAGSAATIRPSAPTASTSSSSPTATSTRSTAAPSGTTSTSTCRGSTWSRWPRMSQSARSQERRSRSSKKTTTRPRMNRPKTAKKPKTSPRMMRTRKTRIKIRRSRSASIATACLRASSPCPCRPRAIRA